ncbi:MAG: hypothetical protein IPP08_11130 [Chlorobiota bacterium]|jgi:hypothetical protein|nr:hypothetical protein [Chlorobiota bacterium]QQS66306.1 MAG: hypothetical protein IPP08_11130 [Chlorobiota bacterium]
MESNIKTCNFCNGNNLVSDLIVEVINDTGNIGFHYESESKSYFNTNSEKIFAQLCRYCGTVIRMYVKNPDRKWLKKY